MKVAYFDCFSGASGDMTLGALLACGADEAVFRERLTALNVPGYELTIERVKREGITAMDVDVKLLEVDQGHGRHLSDIREILDASPSLPERVRRDALAIFTRLADAEAKIHGTSRDEIHFHEVGAVDAIVDIVGACILLDLLGVEKVYTAAIPCGHGTITCQHGIMPLPAPATLELLAGFPIYDTGIRGELVTPTGAAIITTLADPAKAGRMPPMRVLTNGFGAGKKQFVPDMPNLLRIIIGEIDDATVGSSNGSGDATPRAVAVLETNLDDETPEAVGYVMEQCLTAGALDAFCVPAQMKKGRPGALLTVLCTPERADDFADLLFRETGTFGIRHRTQERYTLTRTWASVATAYGEVRLKVGAWHGEPMTAAPEYEDCRRAAVEHGVPLRRVYDAARAAYGAGSSAAST